MSGNKIVINQTSGLDQININQDAPKIVQVNQPVTNIVEVRSIGPQGIQGPSGTDAESPFRQTGSYWSTEDDIYITGSLRVTNTIIVQGAISASVFSGSFVGNGAGLTNITASTVEFNNVINKPTLISSSLQFNDLSLPFTGSYTGSFSGDGVNLYNIPATGITGLNLSRIASGSVTASISPDSGFQVNTNTSISGTLSVTGSIQVTDGASGSFSGSFQGDGAGLTNIPASGIVGLNLNQISSGSVSASISPDSGLQINTNVTATSFTGSLQGSASYAATASIASIQYVTSSIESLSQIEVADFDSNVAVTFVNGRLKFIFGTPTAPSAPAFSFNSTFATDRFNQVLDTYTATGTIAVGAYTLISASIYEGSTLLANTGSGTTLAYNATTSGSHTYRLEVTASSPLDGTINRQSTSLSGTLSKSNPGSPTISATPTVQLGATSNQIEQGATGSITFASASGASNSWVFNYMASTPAGPTIFVTGSATGSTSITISATAYYSSSGVNGSDNSPALTTTATSATTTYTKIRSLRYGVSTSSSFSAAELENLSLWDTTLGGTIGTIAKGTTTATGQSVALTWTGDKYHYIVYNSSLADLTNITAAGFSVFSSFTKTTVGSYKVYKTTLLQSGYAGTSITYVLT
jgi:hypothetical protein